MISAPEHLSRDVHPVLDDPRKWTRGMRPPLFDSVAFQKQIDWTTEVLGAVKLLWAPDWEEWKPRRVGETVYEETAPAHSALNDSKGNPVAPPRWMVVSRLEPEQWKSNWDKNRWFTDPRDGYQYDLRGPAPDERFQFLFTIADHDDHCCLKRHRETLVCWGYYRDPNAADLLRIKRSWSKSLNDPVDPHRPVEALGETQYERDEVTKMQHETQRRKEVGRLRFKDALSIYSPSQLRVLQDAMINRYCVVEAGKKIHQAVERTQNERSVG